MANIILTDTNPKNHMQQREELATQLDRAKALAHVALSEHFYNSQNRIKHNYLSLLEDIRPLSKPSF